MAVAESAPLARFHCAQCPLENRFSTLSGIEFVNHSIKLHGKYRMPRIDNGKSLPVRASLLFAQDKMKVVDYKDRLFPVPVAHTTEKCDICGRLLFNKHKRCEMAREMRKNCEEKFGWTFPLKANLER